MLQTCLILDSSYDADPVYFPPVVFKCPKNYAIPDREEETVPSQK